MRQEHEPYDLDASPELLRLAEEVRASGKPRALRRGRDGEVLAVLLPFTGRGPGRLKKRALSAQDIADFRDAAGTWSDAIDLDAFLNSVYTARDVPEDRHAVDL